MYLCRARPNGKPCGHRNEKANAQYCEKCGRTRKASNDRIYHNPRGPGSNVLCLNGSAHAKTTPHDDQVTCPACVKMMRTGCSATDAISAWEDPAYVS